MTPPRMPDHEPDDVLDLTPPDSLEDESEENMDLTPPDVPDDDEPDERSEAPYMYWPEDEPEEPFGTGMPQFMPAGRKLDREPMGKLEEQEEKSPAAGKKWWKLAVLGVVVLVVGLFASKVLGQSSGTSGGQRGQATSTVATPTPKNTQIGNSTIPTQIGPLILLNPGVVRQGTQVTVTGSGFHPGAVVDLTITRQGTTAPLASTFIQADEGGTFVGATLTVPISLSSGNFTVQAKERNGHATAHAVGAVAGGAPTVKLGEQVGKPGDIVVLALHGFAPEETINVYWNTMSGQPITTFQADGGGGVGQAKLQVPIGALGNNTFLFVGAKSQSLVAANFLVLRLYPTVKLASYALRADNVMSYSGSGFGPSERVFVFLNSLNTQPIAVVPTDATGAFKNATGFLVPFTLKGKQTLIFMGEQTRTPDVVNFTILPYSPVITPSTYGGTPGTTITFFVTGFASNEIVHVYAGHTKSANGTMIGCFQTNSRGSAAAVGSYLIPGNAQGALGFSLVGEKSGGVGLASVNVTAPPAPVQTPPQPPFTCPLDQPGQQPNQQQPGQQPGQQQPDQQQPGQQQPDQQQPGQQQPGQQQPDQQQPNQPAAPQGNVMQPDRQVALRSGANGMAGGVTYVTYVSSAASITNAAPSPVVTSQLSLARESAHPAPAEPQDTLPRSDVPTRLLSGVLGTVSIPPLLIGLGLLWMLVVCGLTLSLILRSTWRANPHRLRARQDHTLTNNPVAVVVAAPSRRPKEIQSEVVQPSTAVGYNGGAFDTTPYRLPSADARHWPSSMDSPAAGLSSGVTAQAAWCTLARQGTDDGYQTRRDATFVETDLKLTGGGSSAFGLFLVADGKSSGRAHLTASSTAVKTIARRVIPAMIGRPAVPPHLLLPLLKYAVIQAGDALLAQNAIAGTDTCTTVTGALVAGGRAYIVNVGNSRTYFYNARDGLWQITKDHSVLSGMVSAGFVGSRALDMPSHAQQLYRSLGDANRPIRVDTFEMPVLHPDDQLLLCSDGLWREVPDSRIETILRTTADPRVATQALIKEASGGSCSIRDDISAIVVRIGDGGARGGGEVHAAEGGEALRSAL